jgi:hypothetical protein
MECRFCKKIFASAGNLKKHQEKTKKCLSLQNKKAETIYTCDYCKKEFTRQDIYERHLVKHINNPVEQENNRLKTEIEQLKNECERLRTENESKEIENLKKIDKLERFINEQKAEMKEKEKTIERLATKAISRKSVTNNYNNTYINVDNLTPVSTRLIGEHTPKNFTFDVICPVYSGGEIVLSGGACIAKWILENPLKNNIWCSDVQRQIMKYRSENIIVSDVKGRKLWACIINLWGLFLEDYLITTIMKLNRRPGLTEDEENFIRKLNNIKGDLSLFTKHNTKTNTEKEFIKYLSENAHTKESLMRFFAEQEKLVQSGNMIVKDIMHVEDNEEEKEYEEDEREYDEEDEDEREYDEEDEDE